jgi:phospholipase C
MLLMRGQWGNILSNAHTLDKLKQRWHDSRPPPSVIYCEPFFNDFATVLNLHGNCNHPPLPMAYGETFLRTVYTTLTSNPARWARTMLIICYDEHGGFFDHVPPPAMRYAPQPGAEWLDPAPFDTLGLRIPGIIVSPLVEHQSACHALLDHTSILQLMVDKFGSPDDLAFFGDASNRKASGIRSLAETITRTTPRPSEGVTLRPAPVPADPAPTSTRELTPGAQLFERLLAMKPKAQLDRR